MCFPELTRKQDAVSRHKGDVSVLFNIFPLSVSVEFLIFETFLRIFLINSENFG